MKIYADILISVNFFMDIFIFYASSVLMRSKTALKRILLASFICSLCCGILSFVFINNAVLSMAAAAIMLMFSVKVIFKPPALKSFISSCGVVLLVSFFCAGVFVWICGYSNIIWFMHDDFFLTGTVFAICFGSVTALFAIWHKKIRRTVLEENTYIKMLIEYNGKKVDVNLFADSGCSLERTSSGRYIFIVQLYDMLPLFDEGFSYEILKCQSDEEIMCTAEMYGIGSSFEMVDFSTAAGNGKLAALKCHGAIKNYGNEIYRPVLAAIYRGQLFKDNDCGGLIGSRCIKEMMGDGQ